MTAHVIDTASCSTRPVVLLRDVGASARELKALQSGRSIKLHFIVFGAVGQSAVAKMPDGGVSADLGAPAPVSPEGWVSPKASKAGGSRSLIASALPPKLAGVANSVRDSTPGYQRKIAASPCTTERTSSNSVAIE
jgi:hypothetical protein